MGYLEDFQAQINNRNFSKFLQLWEEYCASDSVEADEFIQLLQAIKASDFTRSFGQFVETALPLWRTVTTGQGSYDVLKHLIDLQTTNTPLLAEVTLDTLKSRYGQDALIAERLRLTGLRNRENFQGALSSFDLLMHMQKGNFVFHTGGWGVGEIMEVSELREQLAVEFQNVAGTKHITFLNAFKTLVPLPAEHFLARRFSDADNLEKDAKKDPVGVIKMLLRDIGPKTASEIKDELCNLVIPEGEWTKWWQGARARLKKDPIIESPESTKAPFQLRKTEVTHDEKLQSKVHSKTNIDEVIQGAYDVLRDSATKTKKNEANTTIKEKLLTLLTSDELTSSRKLQVLIILDTFFGHEVSGNTLKATIEALNFPQEEINAIEILAIKKRALALIREFRSDWSMLFISLLFTIPQSLLKDYILKELLQDKASKALFDKECKKMIDHPTQYPEFLVWYFNKIVSGDIEENLPYSDKQGLCTQMEAFLTLLSSIENKPEYRDLVKKMTNLLSAKRYAVVRQVI
jgi:transcription elongation factor GreA-like protein